MKLIETYRHEGDGYNPFLIRDGWQVAVLNYSPAEDIESIRTLDIHHFTDEVFLLLKGDVVLVSACIDGDRIEYDNVRLKQGTIYNIPENVWHKVAMKPDSSVLIVEKDKTHIGDFEFHNLTQAQIEALKKDVYSKYL